MQENYVANGIASLDQGLRATKITRPRFITSDFINFVGNVLLWNPWIFSEHNNNISGSMQGFYGSMQGLSF